MNEAPVVANACFIRLPLQISEGHMHYHYNILLLYFVHGCASLLIFKLPLFLPQQKKTSFIKVALE